MKTIDARGLNCPEPILKTKKVLDSEEVISIKVIVDNEAASQNVSRFLQNQSFEINHEKHNNDWIITGNRDKNLKSVQNQNMEYDYQSCTIDSSETQNSKIMVMCTSDKMGRGDDILGAKLMINFIKTLPEMQPQLWALVLVNSGVRLTIEGSEVLTQLKEFEKSDIKVFVCGTCLSHFNLLEKKEVGQTTNMLDIVTLMQLADKVINIS